MGIGGLLIAGLDLHIDRVDHRHHVLWDTCLDFVHSLHEAGACPFRTAPSGLRVPASVLSVDGVVKGPVPPLELLLEGSLGGRGLLARRLLVLPLHVVAKQVIEWDFFLFYNDVC